MRDPDRLLDLACALIISEKHPKMLPWEGFSDEEKDEWREGIADSGEWIDLMMYVEEKQGIHGVMFLLILGDKVLMEKCPKKAKYFPGEWFIPGGWVENDDLTPYHSMEREMMEELGCRPQNTNELPIVDATDSRGKSFFMRPFVIGKWEGVVPDFCLDKPGTELAWVGLERARDSPVAVIRATIAMAMGIEND